MNRLTVGKLRKALEKEIEKLENKYIHGDKKINAIVRVHSLNVRNSPYLCYGNFPISKLFEGDKVKIEKFKIIQKDSKARLWGKIKQKYKEEWICLDYCILEVEDR